LPALVTPSDDLPPLVTPSDDLPPLVTPSDDLPALVTPSDDPVDVFQWKLIKTGEGYIVKTFMPLRTLAPETIEQIRHTISHPTQTWGKRSTRLTLNPEYKNYTNPTCDYYTHFEIPVKSVAQVGTCTWAGEYMNDDKSVIIRMDFENRADRYKGVRVEFPEEVNALLRL
jgi:hypothetical protein